MSDYAQFAEFPDACVVKIPLGSGEVEKLLEFFLADLPSPANAQRAWLEENATVEKTVDGYMAALSSEARGGQGAGRGSKPSLLPLFLQLSVVGVSMDANVTLTIRNDGHDTIRTRTYGQPEYRLIAKLFDGEREVQDRWLALPCDLRAGQAVTLTFPRIRKPATALRLYHALQDVPVVDDAPWETVDVR